MLRTIELRSSGSRTRNGFTLVEVVVVALILGLLAAVAVPKLIANSREAVIAAAIHDVHAIEEAASMYRAQNGSWPAVTGYWNAPGDFEGYINARVFKNEPPIGSTPNFGWTWYRNYNGIEAFIYLYNTNPPLDLWQELDDRYDDGDLATGGIYLHNATILFFIVEDI